MEILAAAASCRIGDCTSLRDLWDRLVSPLNGFAFTQGDKAWFNVLKDKGLFDASFFGLLPKDARLWCPSRKLLLMCVWETIERSGTPVDTIMGKKYGCFVCKSCLFALQTAQFGLQL